MKVTAFWDISPCSLVEVDRRFRGAYWLWNETTRRNISGGYLSSSVYGSPAHQKKTYPPKNNKYTITTQYNCLRRREVGGWRQNRKYYRVDVLVECFLRSRRLQARFQSPLLHFHCISQRVKKVQWPSKSRNLVLYIRERLKVSLKHSANTSKTIKCFCYMKTTEQLRSVTQSQISTNY
jgi:hypothetical protein